MSQPKKTIMSKYVTPREACKLLSVSDKTLRNWDEAGKIRTIRTPSNQRRYDIDSVLTDGTVKQDSSTLLQSQ